MKSTEKVKIPLLFDLCETLDCGQAFRWSPLPDEPNTWCGVAKGKFLRIEQSSDSLTFFCSQAEFDDTWREYFDLDEDYAEKRRRLAAFSPALREATEFAPGIRLLRQEPWEALCSFIISQNNHIPRIKGIISLLCENFGEEIPSPLDTPVFSFPSAKRVAALSEEDLSIIRAGFRDRYILDAARAVSSGEIDIEKISSSPIEFGRKELMKICGVGPKVAECVLLFGFHKTEGFPMDTWMKKAMATLFSGVSPEVFGSDAGLAQQYIFHYSRLHPELFPK